MQNVIEHPSHYVRYEFKEFGGKIFASEHAFPEVSGSEILVKTDFCGVCHSDVHIHEGFYGLGDGKKLTLEDRGIRLPVTLGHEVIGTVAAVGDSVDQSMVGKQFLVYPWVGCGECHECKTDQENLCTKPASLGVFRPGGYAQYVVVPHRRHLVDVTGLEPARASMLACSGLTVYSAIKKVLPVANVDSVVVIGCGGLGQLAIRMLHAMGIKNVHAVDISAEKREIAKESGATHAYDPTEDGVTQKILNQTENRAYAVLDFVGNEQSVNLGLSVLKKGSKLVIVGLHGGELRYPIPVIITKAISVIGSYTGSLGELKELVKFAHGNNFTDIPLEIRDLDQADSAVNDLEQGKVKGRIILQSK